jgi:hypothetical protein
VQDEEMPEGYEVEVDELDAPKQNPVQYMVDRMEHNASVDFDPIRPGLSREAQRINDAAAESAKRGEEVFL